MTHREIAVVVALAIPLVGLLIEFIRGQLLLRDFSDVRKEVQTLVKGIGGEIDRDQSDLLVRGHYGQWPVLVRFSRSEYEAGVSVQMPVPSNLTLYCYPVTHEGQEGSVPLRTSDERFMSHFRLSTNNSPLEVSMILSSPAVLSELTKITDAQTYLTLENRNLELAEAVIVPEHLASRLMNCVRGMARIAAEATEVHGGSGAVPKAPKRATNWFRIAYLAAPALILIALGVLAFLERPTRQAGAQPAPAEKAMPEALAAQVPQLQDWHVNEVSDFDATAVSWLQQQGQHASGHVTANLEANAGQDSVYILKRPAGPPGTNANRLILFIKDQKRYDAELPQVAIAGRISKDRLGSVEWRGRGPSGSPDGDGIIVIQRYNDPSSAIVFFLSGPKLLTGVPKDFRALSLE